MDSIKKFIALVLTLLLLVPQIAGSAVTVSHATDSPEKTALLQAQDEAKAQREAQKDAVIAARDQQKQAQEEKKAQKDNPTPTDTPSPTQDPSTPTPAVSATNDTSGLNSQNNASGSADTQANVNVGNSASLTQNLTTTSNTGGNQTSGDLPATTTTPTPSPASDPGKPLPSCQDNQKVENNPTSSDPNNQLVDNTSQTNQGVSSEGTSSSTNQQVQNTSGGTATPTPPGAVTGSSTTTTTTNNDGVTVSSDNCANIKNDQAVSSSTGTNTQTFNSSRNSMGTGDATSSASLQNSGNTNVVEVSGNNQNASNGGTEKNSSNNATANNTTNLTVDNNNHASAENNLNVSSSTGSNLVANNEGNAKLSSGDIDMIVNMMNILNMNIAGTDFTHLLVNIFGNLTGEIDLDAIAQNLGVSKDEIKAIARNSQTGQNSQNNAQVNNQTNLTVNNNNTADVKNTVDVSGVTGANNVSNNEHTINVQTGRIKIMVALMNFINTNFSGKDWYFAMVNIFGNLRGDILLPNPNGYLVDSSVNASNTTTGANSTNDATAQGTSTIAASSQNQANVTNNVTVNGDSGSNAALGNDGRVNQGSGQVNVVNNALSWLNTSIFGDRWVLLIVNVMGRWMGHVVAFPGQGNIKAPDNGLLIAAAGAGGNGPAISAENSQTGNGSNNNASVSDTSNFQVNNTNAATVENNVNISGVSGQNSANQNQGRANLYTGWVDITSGLLNVVNMSVTGQHWLMVMVNVFGDFWGNLVFPDGSSPTAQIQQVADAANTAIGNTTNPSASGTANTSTTDTHQTQTQTTATDSKPSAVKNNPPVNVLKSGTEADFTTEANAVQNSSHEQVSVFSGHPASAQTTTSGIQIMGLNALKLPLSDREAGLSFFTIVLMVFMFIIIRRLRVHRRREVK